MTKTYIKQFCNILNEFKSTEEDMKQLCNMLDKFKSTEEEATKYSKIMKKYNYQKSKTIIPLFYYILLSASLLIMAISQLYIYFE